MVRHLLDIENVVHCEGSDGIDCALCGDALEGINGDTPMIETEARISCDRCLSIIRFSRKVRNEEMAH